jgi:hypothetical protein
MTKINLYDPTPASEIKTRQGPGGRLLSYIDARFVMDRLDAAVGPARWQDRYEDRSDGSVRCGIGITFDDVNWIWKWDAGDPSDIEATKGVHSDAFKRAGVKWGIGRDLYGEKPAPRAVRPAPTPIRPQEETPFDGDPMPVFDGLLVDESACPDHGYKWRQNTKGYYCSGKTQGKWCERKPSKAWIASQELVPAG